MPVYLTVSEACEVLGIHRNTLYKRIKQGAPVHHWGPSGRQYRIVAAEFIAWMDKRGERQLPDTSGRYTLNTEDMAQRRREMLQALA